MPNVSLGKQLLMLLMTVMPQTVHDSIHFAKHLCRGVEPVASLALTLAPACSRICIKGMRPLLTCTARHADHRLATAFLHSSALPD